MPQSNSPTELPQPRRIRQTRRGIQRSEGIIRAASNLFLEKGYEGSSMEEIIQRSGGSKSHIYREFGGKDGLFLASVKFLCDEVQLSIETVDVSALSVKAGLKKLALSLVQVLLTERHLALQRLVFAEGQRFHKAGEIWFERGPQMTHRIFSRYFESCMRARLLRRADPMLAASLFCDMLSGHILDRAWLGIGRRPSRAEAKRTINAAVDVFLNGYGGLHKN
jgi:TetR/AcrR family transcriptional regulator, mexJK operon transcriptional repressor